MKKINCKGLETDMSPAQAYKMTNLDEKLDEILKKVAYEAPASPLFASYNQAKAELKQLIADEVKKAVANYNQAIDELRAVIGASKGEVDEQK